MKTNLLLIIPTLALSAALLFTGPGGEAAGPREKPHEQASHADDQEALSVTVYNSNLGLVKETRRLTLPAGITELKFSDVAAQIMPQTVHILSLTDPAGLGVLEQNYEYDLLSPQKLLDKFVGKEIKVLRDGVEIPITILSTHGGIVYRMGDRIFTDPPGKMIFPGLPENLLPNPTLVWRLENETTHPQNVEATYLTNGMTWRSDYVAILDKEDQKIDLTGWVTLDNKSGATFKNAKLKLVAGDVNRVLDRFETRDAPHALEMAAQKSAAAPFTEESFFEYHLYSLQRPTTLKDNQTKQVTLLTANQVPVKKRFLYHGAAHFYRTQYGTPISNQKVGVYVEIANKKENQLGMPLPKGTLRVYKADSDGSLQFIGEDRIDHTPKDETIKIKMGDAFDLVAQRKQTEWKKIAWDTYEVAFEVSLRNHKETSATISVVEPIPGDWEILKTTHDYQKVEAHTVQFDVPVGKDKEVKLQYRVRVRF
ncbi:MAG: DUF4139 domain-containing protein [Candidatus Manganitrophus sp. SA1]|nr:DUF4139 domain-containing protein [Candidatus Manganitrophus morganii]